MPNYKTSIFNDVLGPVMTGPSSSHTAAPGRIGLFAGALMPDFKTAHLFFPKSSSYAATYKGQKSDIAFAAGLLGLPLNHPDFKNSRELFEKEGRSFTVTLSDGPCGHPNTSELVLEGPSGVLSLTSQSTGGGMFCITAINGIPVDFRGDRPVLAGFCEKEKSLLLKAFFENLPTDLAIAENLISGSGFCAIVLKKPLSAEDLQILSHRAAGILRHVPPILPVAAVENITLPFSTAKTLVEFLTENPMPLWRAAAVYEAARSGWSEDRVVDYSKDLVTTMLSAVRTGLQGSRSDESLLAPAAASMADAACKGLLLPLSPYQWGAVYSTAVMEASNAMGVVVAGPTAGSCGVLPGVLFGLLHTSASEGLPLVSLSEKELDHAARALLTAGIIGVFIAEQATFAAELCGCQAENGAASAMAAAMAADLMGGDAFLALKAASTALQNVLGLICDPVACRVELPCISRNAMAVSNALTSAEMTLGGYDSRLPLDEVIETMYRVGQQLPAELCCTGKGGLCLTSAAENLSEKCKS